jgi:hypothetical protein
MNKFLELEKRFEKVMKSIEKLHFKQSNEEVSSEINDVSTAQKLSNDQINKLSNKVVELERAARVDSQQIDKLIIDLESLLENKND